MRGYYKVDLVSIPFMLILGLKLVLYIMWYIISGIGLCFVVSYIMLFLVNIVLCVVK